jgi:hypothetical protein
MLNTLLAIDAMGNTFRFIFVTLGIVLFILAGLVWYSNRWRLEFIGLGLAAVFFPQWWDLLATISND